MDWVHLSYGTVDANCYNYNISYVNLPPNLTEDHLGIGTADDECARRPIRMITEVSKVASNQRTSKSSVLLSLRCTEVLDAWILQPEDIEEQCFL